MIWESQGPIDSKQLLPIANVNFKLSHRDVYQRPIPSNYQHQVGTHFKNKIIQQLQALKDKKLATPHKSRTCMPFFESVEQPSAEGDHEIVKIEVHPECLLQLDVINQDIDSEEKDNEIEERRRSMVHEEPLI